MFIRNPSYDFKENKKKKPNLICFSRVEQSQARATQIIRHCEPPAAQPLLNCFQAKLLVVFYLNIKLPELEPYLER